MLNSSLSLLQSKMNPGGGLFSMQLINFINFPEERKGRDWGELKMSDFKKTGWSRLLSAGKDDYCPVLCLGREKTTKTSSIPLWLALCL